MGARSQAAVMHCKAGMPICEACPDCIGLWGTHAKDGARPQWPVRRQACTWMLNSATEPVLPVPMQPPIRTISMLSRTSGNRVTSRAAFVSAPVQTSMTRSCLHEGAWAVKVVHRPAACKHPGWKRPSSSLSCCTACRSFCVEAHSAWLDMQLCMYRTAFSRTGLPTA